MATPALYDAHADWYEEYIGTATEEYNRRVDGMLRDLLGGGTGGCLDVCCGTGARAGVLRELGWTPLGVDLSRGQLRYGVRRLPAAVGGAAALPVRDGAVPAAVCVLGHTDLPDYPAVLREVARALRPGGRFVHVGVHPCFVGAFADRRDPTRIVVDERYAERDRTLDAWCPSGVRARVGAWHVPVADLVNAVTAAGLRLLRAAEAGPGGVPDIFGLLATKGE
ncbi:class I SAM-dependent methyltransferase [Micromonospora sp. NPDC049559]|uniref:class I SAM-dependent methyltransferase n=1 Tax=Micromonospora sp. NPDC049559 TaxID=3155923 RepID=UPI00342BB1CD